MKKPAAKSPSEEIIQFVYTRDYYACQYCGKPAQGKPHHWGVHNKKENRAKYPLLIHHPANLVCVDYPCHQHNGSGDNLPESRIDAIERHLEKDGDCYLDIDDDGGFDIIMKEITNEHT